MGGLGLAFKALTWKVKAGIFAGLLFLLTITHGSAYFIGLNKGKAISGTKIAEYETKVANLQTEVVQAQAKINTKVETKYIDRVVTETQVQYVNRDIIKDRIVNRDVTLSNGWIYAHNQAVNGQQIDPNLAGDGTQSGVTDSAALQTVATNLTTARLCAAQNDAWKDWYAQTKKMYDEYSAARGKEKKK